jgi:hypothetical protein
MEQGVRLPVWQAILRLAQRRSMCRPTKMQLQSANRRDAQGNFRALRVVTPRLHQWRVFRTKLQHCAAGLVPG